MKIRNLFAALAVVFGGFNGAARAADYGDLTATFLYDGAAPKAAAIDANKDPEVCGKVKLFNEELVVNPTNGGVANVVVYIYVKPGGAKPVPHADYAKLAAEKVELDNKNCRFEPHIAVVRTGQTLVLKNSDPVGHNTKIDFLSNTPQNPIIPGGAMIALKPGDTKVEEKLPTSVSCSIHPWMQGKVVVKDHPYVAVSDADGKISMKNIPAGNWTFQVWHEKVGFVSKVKVGGAAKDWAKGRVDQTIKAGANSLGEIKVAL